MGRSLITPPPSGDTCGVCWGSGLTFGSGVTPSVVTAVFSGIDKGSAWLPGDGEPPNGSYQLSQSLSCAFLFESDAVDITLDFSEPGTSCVAAKPAGLAFDGQSADICQLVLQDSRGFLETKFFGGEVTISL